MAKVPDTSDLDDTEFAWTTSESPLSDLIDAGLEMDFSDEDAVIQWIDSIQPLLEQNFPDVRLKLDHLVQRLEKLGYGSKNGLDAVNDNKRDINRALYQLIQKRRIDYGEINMLAEEHQSIGEAISVAEGVKIRMRRLRIGRQEVKKVLK